MADAGRCCAHDGDAPVERMDAPRRTPAGGGCSGDRRCATRPDIATGVAAHGIGTARAFQVSEQAGAFAALAMGLNGALTALLLPLFAGWLGAG